MNPGCRYEPEGHTVAHFEIRPAQQFRSSIFELSKALPANVFFKMYYYPSGKADPHPENPTAEMGIILTDFGSFSTLHCNLQCRITNDDSKTILQGERQSCTFGCDTKQRWTFYVLRSELEAAQRDCGPIFAEILVETALPETRVGRSLSPVQRRIEASLLSSPEQPEQLEAPPLPVEEDGTATFLFPVESVEQKQEQDGRVRFEGISFMLRYLPNSWGDATFEFFALHFAARRQVPLEFDWSLQNADRITKFRHCEVVELADCECGTKRQSNCNCSHTKVHVLFSVPKKPLRSFAGGKAVCLTLKLRRLEESGDEHAPKSSPFSGLVLIDSCTSFDEMRAATFRLRLPNIDRRLLHDKLREFEGIPFAFRFFPASSHSPTAHFDLVTVGGRKQAPVQLRLEWSLRNAAKMSGFQHSERIEVRGCKCRGVCRCSEFERRASFRVDAQELSAFANGQPVVLVLRVCPAGEPTERPDIATTPLTAQPKLLNGKEEPSSRPSSATPRPSSAANGTRKTRAATRKIPPLSPPKRAEIEIIVLSDDSDVEEERPNANGVANGPKDKPQPSDGQPAEAAGEARPDGTRVEQLETESSSNVLEAPEPAESSALNDQPPTLEAEPQQAHVGQAGKPQVEMAKDRTLSPPETPPRLHRSDSTDDAESGDLDVSIPSSSDDDEADATSTAAPSDRPPKRPQSPKDGEEEAVKKRRKRDLLTLIVDEEQFTVEREPLVATSGYFARAVAENVGATEFQLNGIPAPVLAAIVKWVERREVDRLDKVAHELYVMARVLEIPSLLEKCRDSIKLTCRFANFAQSLIFAVEHEDPELIGAMAFLWRTPDRLLPVLASEEFKTILVERPMFMAKIFKAMNAK